MRIKNAFYDAFKELSNVYKDGNYYYNNNISGYAFNTEIEAEFIEHLFKYMKGNEPSRIINVFKILNNIIGNDSEWKF